MRRNGNILDIIRTYELRTQWICSQLKINRSPLPEIDEDELSAWQVAKEPQKWFCPVFPYDPTFVRVWKVQFCGPEVGKVGET